MAASCSLSVVLLLSLISAALTLRELEKNEAVSSYSHDDLLKTAEQEFLAFKKTYGKSYPTQEEDDYRFGVFVSHLREARRNQLEDPKAIHGVTKFADLTPSEFRSQYLTLGGPIQLSNRFQNASILPTANLPVQFDWREKGAVTGVKNQGRCAACWAFSAIASLEGANFLANKELLSLSEQQLIDCSHECFPNKVCNKGCATGNFILAFDYLLDKGVEKEQNYPFTETTGSCKVDNTKLVASVKQYSVITKDEDQYAANLVQHGPLSVAIDGTVRMKTYNGGIACPPCTSSLNHAVTLVGYNYGSDDGHWIIKNSWGAEWGEKGYYLLCKNGLICDTDPVATAITAAPKSKASHIEII